MQPQPPPTAPRVPAPTYRLHFPASITWATALGTPAAGAVMLGINYWKWGQKSLGLAVVLAGFLTTAVIVWLAYILPASIPAVAFLVPQVLLGYVVARLLQGRRFDEHVRAGGKAALTAIGAGVGLVFGVVFIAAVGVWFLITGFNPQAVLDSQRSVEFGHGQEVFYSRGATRDDAHDFGAALEEGGYFDDTVPIAVWIAGSVGAREISFIGGEHAWDDAANVDYLRQLVEYIASDIGGEPIAVRLLDEQLNEVKHCRLDKGWRCVTI